MIGHPYACRGALRVPVVSVLVGLLFASSHAIIAAPTPPARDLPAEEAWYQVSLAGEPAGHLVERRRALPSGDIVSESVLKVSLARGETEVTMTFESSFTETATERPVSASGRQLMGNIPLSFHWRFTADHIELRSGDQSGAAGAADVQILPLPTEPWLTPMASARQVEETVRSGGDSYAYSTLDPASGPSLVQVEGRRLSAAEVHALGSATGANPATGTRAAETSLWREVVRGAMITESLLWRDAEGRMVRSSTELLGLDLTFTRTDRETALAAHGAPELMVRTFVRPSRPIPRPRSLEHAVYRLSLAGGGEVPSLPQAEHDKPVGQAAGAAGDRASAGGQWTQRLEGGSIRVEVISRPVAPGSSRGAPPSSQEELAPYLEASPYLDHRDPAIRELLAGAALPEHAPAKAEALRQLVHRHIQRKDLATGFATASEVVATRAGDCTEHAVLLAALLRAARIPSRVVSGLLYVESFAGEEGIFGYHMWTQGLVDGHWVDLDAMTTEAFDAAHIALEVSALRGTEGPALLGGVLYAVGGRLEIEVLELDRW